VSYVVDVVLLQQYLLYCVHVETRHGCLRLQLDLKTVVNHERRHWVRNMLVRITLILGNVRFQLLPEFSRLRS
jgi:uncharacterized membrane protein